MFEECWDDCVDIVCSQVCEGVYLFDVCVDYVGCDGVVDIWFVVFCFVSVLTFLFVVDLIELVVLQVGMELIGGCLVVNLVNFEDGEGFESCFGCIMLFVKEYGVVVIVLMIDEEGQVCIVENKVCIVLCLVDSLVGEWGMCVDDIIVDVLIFLIVIGQEEI